MKKVLLLNVIIFTLLFTGCIPGPPITSVRRDFKEVELGIKSLEQVEDFIGSENYIREALLEKWAEYQNETLLYHLGYSLYMQKKYKKSINVFKQMEQSERYRINSLRYGADAAFKSAEYGEALDFMLRVYLYLEKEQKVDASRIVFLSYLYLEKYGKASKWYSRLNGEKRARVAEELAAFLKEHPDKAKLFETEEGADDGEDIMVTIPPDDVEDVVEQTVFIDEDYIPDWKRACLFLPADERWGTINETIKSSLEWYFSKRATDVTLNVYFYNSSEEIETGFGKAKEEKCFGIIGPIRFDPYSEDFVAYSKKYSIPVFAFSSFFDDKSPLFFNFRYTKDREIDTTTKYYIGKERTRFAIAYPDSFKGRKLRDSYWEIIEKNGGTVTDALAFNPLEKGFSSLLDEIVKEPANLYSVIRRFKKANREKYSTSTLMGRAIKRIKKKAPAETDFDVLFIIASKTKQISMLVPALSYKNVEFEYHSGYEKRRIRKKQREIRADGLSWTIKTVALSPPSEVKDSASFEKNMGNLIDGMIVSAPIIDETEVNGDLMKLKGEFKKKFSRDTYKLELYIFEMANIIDQALSKSPKENINTFLSTLKSEEFESILAKRKVKFNEKFQLSENDEIFIGIRTEGFQLLKDVEEKDKKKAMKKKKGAGK